MVTGLEGPTTVRVGSLEAIDGTPIIDLKVAMPESPDAYGTLEPTTLKIVGSSERARPMNQAASLRLTF